ncbi:sensor histidine kinase [Poseidonibacter antarcticus]|uniref:sensor histidine kinase n=1 Tax=Poseidonibacter antarcticus TaxID=2478538 RepID=UPI000EF46A04|nr:HAMP domain-containing sensor histidine kinase [Poseidonibacter antarcticus]
MLFIALLYFQNEKKLYFDLTKTKMQNVVSNITSQIIFSHMKNKKIDTSQFLRTKLYKIAFYDKDKKKMYGNLDEKIDFSKKIIKKDKYFILLDNSTYGHLGIYYIAIKENVYFQRVQNLKNEIIILFMTIYTILALIGFYLARLFLKPIKDEREKLNNFIKDTTHELNTPISAILMSCEKEELSKKQIERIRLASVKISEIYKDLTYIFLEDKEKKINLEDISLKEIIEEELKYFDVLAQKKKITINISLEELKFMIDKNDFIRVFNNILSNAIKYNKKTGFINIELKDKKLLIKDSGIGIEEKKVKDIFNRYYRATNDSGGFGIGLNIVKNICDEYKIKIDVHSKIKEGTTFILTFN